MRSKNSRPSGSRRQRIVILLSSLLFSFATANAQVSFDHLSVKGSSSGYLFGAGGLLEYGIPITRGDKIIIEPNYNYFGDRGRSVFLYPILAGYRHSFNHKGYGLYVQAVTGYTFGSTFIPKTNAQGDTLGYQRGNGFTAGLGLGYSFKYLDYCLELRYEHIFVAGDPPISIVSIRYLYTIFFPRHRQRDHRD